MTHAETVARAEVVMTRALGRPAAVRLVAPIVEEPGYRSTVLRCTCVAGDDAPVTVIVKRANGPAAALRAEWAALEFLDTVDAARDLMPRLYGGATGAGEPDLLVLEDLEVGSARLLGVVLEEATRDEAETALVAHQQALARLQGATWGLGDELARARDRRGVSVRTTHRVHELAAALRDLPELLASIGVAGPAALPAELESIAGELEEQGPLHTFTHGDPTPPNAFCAGTIVRFVDLETAAYRHALLDGVFSRLRYLHSAWARRIPGDLQHRLLAAYRTELGAWCAAAADDERFDRGLVAAGAAWLGGICRLLPSVLDEDRPWGRATVRERIVTALEHAVELTEERGGAGAVGEAARLAHSELTRRWGPLELAPYPAFATA